MINEQKLLEDFEKITFTSQIEKRQYKDLLEHLIAQQTKVECSECSRRKFYQQGYKDGLMEDNWIPCSERLPEERESIFKRFKGTDKWSNAMFEGNSDEVNVTVEYEDGTRKSQTSHTLDGKWKCEKEGIQKKVIAWQPLPEPYK